MGLGLWPYRVDLKVLTTLPASGSADFEALLKRVGRRLAALDKQRADDIADGDVRPAAVELAAIADGKRPRGGYDGFVVEALCAAFGKQLSNAVWEKYRTKFFSDLDDELTARGLAGDEQWVKIVSRGIPLAKGRVTNPECGATPPDVVRVVARKMDQMDLSKLNAEQKRGAAEWRRWLRAAQEHRQALVIFNY